MEALLNEGLKVLVLGMTAVFVFLVVMVLVIEFSAWILRLLKVEEKEMLREQQARAKSGDSAVPVPVISAAIAAYLRMKGK